MKKIKLYRVAGNNNGTFGAMVDEDIPFCLTVERQWLNNQSGISCIPDGVYTCQRGNFPKHGNTFEVMNVPGRTAILFHKGNIDDDSHGCIVVGEQYGYLGDHVAVLASGPAFDEFLKRLEGINTFELTIKTVTL